MSRPRPMSLAVCRLREARGSNDPFIRQAIMFPALLRQAVGGAEASEKRDNQRSRKRAAAGIREGHRGLVRRREGMAMGLRGLFACLWLPLLFLAVPERAFGQSCEGSAAPTVTLAPVATGVQINLAGGTLGTCGGWRVWRDEGIKTSSISYNTTVGCATETGFIDTSAVAGTTYTYLLGAENGSCFGEVFGVETSLVSIDPYMTIASSLIGGGVRLTWSAVSGATSYNLQSKTPSTEFSNLHTGSTATQYDHTSGTTGTEYTYRVMHVTSGNPGDWSNHTTATFPTTACSGTTVTTFSVTPQFDGIQLTWTGGAFGTGSSACDAWEVWRAEGTGEASKVHTESTEATRTWKDATATPGQSYTYHVSLTGDVNKSDAVEIDPYTRLTARVGVGEGKIDLTWTSIATATYEVQSRTGSDAWATLASAVAQNTYSDTAGDAGAAYRYRVRGVVSSTNKSWSNETAEQTFPIETCKTPVISSVEPTSSGVTIEWTGNWGDQCTKWEILRGSGSGTPTSLTTISTEPDTIFVDATAISGSIYAYTVKAENADGTISQESSAESIAYVVLTATKSGENGANLMWAMVPGATGYLRIAGSGGTEMPKS